MAQMTGRDANILSSTDPAKSVLGLEVKGTTAPLPIYNVTGAVVGGIPSVGCAPVQAITTSTSTIGVGNTSVYYGTIPITVSAATITNNVLQPGLFDGHEITIVNRTTTAGNVLVFATTTSTSNVADSAVATTGEGTTTGGIPGMVARSYVWDAGTALWYRYA